MTLLYETENDLCDRHPKLCTSKVPGLELSDEMTSGTDGMEPAHSDSDYFRFECSDDVISCDLGFCEA